MLVAKLPNIVKVNGKNFWILVRAINGMLLSKSKGCKFKSAYTV